MRIALLSDIHGNLISMEAVIADLKTQGVDQVIFLGDIATLGPQPREVIGHIRDLTDQCVLGNHDLYLLKPALGKAYMDVTWFSETIDWCIRQLQPGDFEFLRTFKPLINFQLDDDHYLLCFHGSPQSNTGTILATTLAEELDGMLSGFYATVMAGGHTHVQMMRQHYGTLVINAGSVGMPFQRAPFANNPTLMPWTEYAILDWHNGAFGIDMRRVEVNVDRIKRAALDSTMPDRKEWVKNWHD